MGHHVNRRPAIRKMVGRVLPRDTVNRPISSDERLSYVLLVVLRMLRVLGISNILLRQRRMACVFFVGIL